MRRRRIASGITLAVAGAWLTLTACNANADGAVGAQVDASGDDSASSSSMGVALGGTGGSTGGSAANGGTVASTGGRSTSSGTNHDAASDVGVGDAGGLLSRGPTPPHDGIEFPFPQNRESPNCTYPRGYTNDDVRAAYEKWKNDNVTDQGAGGHLRVRRSNDPGLEADSTVSEGIGYGMLIAAYMGEQQLFDELWKYERQWLDDNGLMDWYINAAGTERLGTGGATDADEDMAYALVMAARQWGGQGSLDRSYLEYATDQIGRVWAFEIFEGKLPRAGDHWGDWNNVNISYFAPSYYRVFAQIDGNTTGWDAVLKTVYDTIANVLNAANGNEANGLVPAWCTSQGVPTSPGYYQYDSCRTPFRIALDWCQFGETRAREYVQKTTSFFAPLGASGIVDGYELDGTPRPEHPGGRSAAFIGPAGVGAMSDASRQAFIDDAYAAVATNELLAGGAYYEESWTVLSLLMLTGNFVNFTAYYSASP